MAVEKVYSKQVIPMGRVARTYHITDDELENFEKYVTAVKKHARINGLGFIDRKDIIGKWMLGLNPKKAADFFKK